MQFRDLKAQHEALKEKIDSGIAQVVKDCNFISGFQVEMLEQKLADYVGVKHCITCANGTDALLLALMAWGIGPGDAVFVPDFTFFSSGEVVSSVGATPVFVDVDARTFNISCNNLERMIEKVLKEEKFVPKAIVAVDLFGQPADYGQIRKIAKKYGLKILEDGAQGFGGRINDCIACSFGDISTTSFFPAKPLGCYGDGGAVFTDNDEWADHIRSLRIHGKGKSKYDNVYIGMNSRLDTIQAAILIPKLEAFKEYELDNVNEIANQYSQQLRDRVITPFVPQNFYSSWAQYTIKLSCEKERDELQKHLREKGIPSMIYYSKAMHKQKAFEHYSYDDCNFETTEQLCKSVLSLPMHPYLKKEDVNMITKCVLEFVG